MGRGVKGKVKKQSTGSGGDEENVPVRRRGRPQKPLKDDIVEEEIEKIEEEEEEDEENESGKSSVLNKDVEKQEAASENGRKRKRASQSKENTGSVKEENGVGKKTEGLKAVGFRQNGSRRKNKPHRAAEVGVECK